MQTLEVRVFGIRRSGNHAIISWIINNYPGSLLFVNNVNGHDTIPFPYSPIMPEHKKPFQDRITVKNIPYFQAKKKFSAFLKFLFTRPSIYSLVPSDKSVNLSYLLNIDKDCLIYSFEDIHISDMRLPRFYESAEKYIGSSKSKINIIILRDPFNLFASLLKSKMIKKNSQDGQKYISLYKTFALSYLQYLSMQDNDTIFINYNQWMSQEDYRIDIANKLGLLPQAKDLIETVVDRGGGSSFDKLSYNNQASSMKVFERWKVYNRDPFYLDLLSEKEILSISQEIFPRITQEFKSNLEKIK
ncbi:MAG: hypothetical protein QNJ42_20695 [Crocosphaera sp.]|nr:hypothetical protein [Crocosphaera sp.]